MWYQQIITWHLAFRFSTCKNCNIRVVAGVPIVRTPIWYVFSRFRFFAWENCNVGVADIETDVALRTTLQVSVPVNKTWLMEGIVYLLVVDVPASVLATDKLEVLIYKDLIIVETYPLMKSGGWDFLIEKK